MAVRRTEGSETTESVTIRVFRCSELPMNPLYKMPVWCSSGVKLLGREWSLRLYPDGYGTGKGTHFGMGIDLVTGADIDAQLRFTIVENGKVLYDGLYVGFKATGTDFGFFAAVTLADFKSLAAKNNDTLTFKIEITMLGEPTTSV